VNCERAYVTGLGMNFKKPLVVIRFLSFSVNAFAVSENLTIFESTNTNLWSVFYTSVNMVVVMQMQINMVKLK
jgi:hypothetical protein